jgi:hypothetical protein
MKNAPMSRKEDIVIQELNNEILIYDLKINKAYCLNETSALVYQLCNGKNSVSDISRTIGKKLKSPVTEDFVWLAIDQLKKENLLDNSQQIETKFEGVSRREVIRRVGFASIVALPVISSIVAPTAAMAQSTCTTGVQGAACTGVCGQQTTCCPGLVCSFVGCANCNPPQPGNGTCQPPSPITGIGVGCFFD